MSVLKMQVILAIFLACSTLAVARKHPQFEELCFKNLKPQDRPDVAFQGEAGMLEYWGTGFTALKDANMVAARLTLKPGGLIMPAYVNVPAMKIVMQGNVSVGILDEATQGNVYKLKLADVVVLPQGVSSWWYNHGDQDAIVLCVGDTSTSPEPATVWPFTLAGAKAKNLGGVLQGFSSQFLAQAWEMSEGDVKMLLNNQQQTTLLKVVNKLVLPETPANTGNNSFIYHYADAVPDFAVDGGGEIRELNSRKMPILRNIRMAAECVRLGQGALVAPNWFVNGHQLIYVHSGTGRIQIVNNAGERVVNMEVQPGSLVLVPKFFPSTVLAGDNGLHFVSIVTNDRPDVSFLGGSNSVFSGIPTQVLSAVFNVDDKMATKLQQTGSKKSVLIPGKRSRKPQP